MNNLTKNSFILFLLLLLANFRVLAESAIYTDLYNKKAEAALQFTTNQVQLGDLLHETKYCSIKDDYFCVISRVFVFSVPKKMPVKTWQRDGASYKIIDQREEWVLGKKISYWVIHQKLGKQELDYIYSADYGVISIKTSKNQLMLSSGCGLLSKGSAANCFYHK